MHNVEGNNGALVKTIKIKPLARLRFAIRMWAKTRFHMVNVRLAKLNYSFTEHRNPLETYYRFFWVHCTFNEIRNVHFISKSTRTTYACEAWPVWYGTRAHANTLYFRKWHSNREKWDIFASMRKSIKLRPGSRHSSFCCLWRISRCHLGWRLPPRFFIRNKTFGVFHVCWTCHFTRIRYDVWHSANVNNSILWNHRILRECRRLSYDCDATKDQRN